MASGHRSWPESSPDSVEPLQLSALKGRERSMALLNLGDLRCESGVAVGCLFSFEVPGWRGARGWDVLGLLRLQLEGAAGLW
jgi:hypothetical protein